MTEPEFVGEQHGLKGRCTECGKESTVFPLYSVARFSEDEEYWEGPFCDQECVHAFWRAISRLALWVRKTEEVEFREIAKSPPVSFRYLDGDVSPRPIPQNPSAVLGILKPLKP